MRLLFDVNSWHLPNSSKDDAVKCWLFDRFYSYKHKLLVFNEPFSSKSVYCELLKVGSILTKDHWVDKVYVDILVKDSPRDEGELEWKNEFGVWTSSNPELTGDEVHDILTYSNFQRSRFLLSNLNC